MVYTQVKKIQFSRRTFSTPTLISIWVAFLGVHCDVEGGGGLIPPV